MTATAKTQPERAIVVVEDDADARELLGMLLQQWGLTVYPAETGAKALYVLEKTQAPLALVDIGLPDMDGYEVARQVRARLGTKVRLVAFTGHGSLADQAAAAAAGFDLHLQKPVTAERLKQVLDEFHS